MDFNELLAKTRKVKGLPKHPPYVLLSLDPGETTGYAIWSVTPDIVNLVEAGQEITWPMDEATKVFQKMIGAVPKETPLIIVHEAYNVYAHKLQQHTHSNVPTLRVIGSIETFASMARRPVFTQTAQVAKAFCTDSNLLSWGFYAKGKKHARDAIRHGAYFVLFGQVDAVPETPTRN